MRFLVLCLTLSACATAAPLPDRSGGPEEAAVLAVVERLFDGMRAGDSAVVRSVFVPDATLSTVTTSPEGAPVLRGGDGIEGFVRAVGQPHEQVWNEQIYNPVVLVDGNLASVWVDYTFQLGETLSHCGVDAFQLFRGADGWKIFHLADTRRQQGCEALLAG